jgi:hypothetical protein
MTKAPTASPTVSTCFILLLVLASQHLKLSDGVIYEDARLKEYHRRNYTWPPLESEFIPATPGWRQLYQRRMKQVDRLSQQDNSYDAYIHSISCALITPNYTESGWGLTRSPTYLWETLNNSLVALPTAEEEEYEDAIDTILRPLFIKLSTEVKDEVLRAVQPILEAWSGVELVPSMAYGLRVYRNTSKLYMHVDRTDTHVLSAILHVNHNAGSQPWPLVIEDFLGNTNEVMLEAGDLLLYESSKCLHGRPRRFNGEWYTSIFVHFYPRHQMEDRALDVHYRVPPHWRESVVVETAEQPVDSFEMIDTFCKEPNCHDEWCALQESVVIRGPGPGYGQVLTTNGIVRELEILPKEDDFSQTSPDQNIEL